MKTLNQAGLLLLVVLVVNGNVLAQTHTAQSPSSSTKTLCSEINKIKSVPFYDSDKGTDKVYQQFLKQGEKMIPCLIENITNVSVMKDPRLAPAMHNFKVGDTSYTILCRIARIPFEQMLPDEIRQRMKKEGIYAYFDFVDNNENRVLLRDYWKKWYAEHTKKTK